MPLPRIPGMDADPERVARRARGRACFLLVTFLCTSKEKSLAVRRKLWLLFWPWLSLWPEASKQKLPLTRVTFLCLCKEKSPKESTPRSAPSALRAPGSQSRWAFFDGTSMCRRKTTRIVRVALRVFTHRGCRAEGARSVKSKTATAQATAWLALADMARYATAFSHVERQVKRPRLLTSEILRTDSVPPAHSMPPTTPSPTPAASAPGR